MSEINFDEYKNHPLYGRRILHVLSPVRWDSKRNYIHKSDSNHKVMEKTISYLPMCHHYILVPEKNSIPNDRPNVTLLAMDYPNSVLLNRAWIDKTKFGRHINQKYIDVDFVFCHQPELLYNVYSLIQGKRSGNTLNSFVFFHWVDCVKSQPIEYYPVGFYRHLDAIEIADYAWIHSQKSVEYILSNQDNEKRSSLIKNINVERLHSKLQYMPLSSDLNKDIPYKKFPLPDKKILLFNHRWAATTGKDRMVSYIEYVRDSIGHQKFDEEYLIWITDEEFNRTMGRSVLPPTYFHIEKLPFDKYLYLLRNVYATLTFVDGYQTWNLSVQDALKLGRPSLVFEQDVTKYIIGDDYPLYFQDKKSFLKLLQDLPKYTDDNGNFEWNVPDHEKTFHDNIMNAMLNVVNNIKRDKMPNNVERWLYHMLNGEKYKANIIESTSVLFGSHNWEYVRSWFMNTFGILDDPTSMYTKYTIPDHLIDECKRIVETTESNNDPGFDWKQKRLDIKFPPNMKNYNENDKSKKAKLLW